MAISVSRVQLPDQGRSAGDSAAKPYWTNGFIPFANQTAANGQAIGNGYYLHCFRNLAGPPVAPNLWVNSDGMPLGSSHLRDWVAEFGAGATDPTGKPAGVDVLTGGRQLVVAPVVRFR